MLGAVDAIMRLLKIPPKFVPYMEKHRIYELFQELAIDLAITQPPDHILFMKQNLILAAKKRDAPRIILLGLPGFDLGFLARRLQTEFGVKPVYLESIRNLSPDLPTECISDEDIVRNLRKILKSFENDYTGWVLVDVPRTKAQARALQTAGIIPTHVMEIVPPVECGCSSETNLQRRNLKELREIYDNFLIRVEVGDCCEEEVVETCVVLTGIRKHCGAPGTFRVALIGSRGSGCRSVAKHLARRFDLVHIDFIEILLQAATQDTSLGEELRSIQCRCGLPKPDMRIRVVEKYLLSDDCTTRGWVLTGYPITVEDFELLDMIPTPPNRVIFVKVDDKTRKERLLNRRYNVITGSKHNLTSKNKCKSDISDKVLAIHPRDCRCIIDQDFYEYDENVESLLCYAGATASIIDGNNKERIVRERVEACLMRAAPSVPPRVPRTRKQIDPMDIEFDPDDEPDPRIFDEIREPESYLSLI